MRARGYEAPLETRVRRGGFIENTLEMVGYLYVCSVVLRLLPPAWAARMHTLCQSEAHSRCT